METAVAAMKARHAAHLLLAVVVFMPASPLALGQSEVCRLATPAPYQKMGGTASLGPYNSMTACESVRKANFGVDGSCSCQSGSQAQGDTEVQWVQIPVERMAAADNAVQKFMKVKAFHEKIQASSLNAATKDGFSKEFKPIESRFATVRDAWLHELDVAQKISQQSFDEKALLANEEKNLATQEPQGEVTTEQAEAFNALARQYNAKVREFNEKYKRKNDELVAEVSAITLRFDEWANDQAVDKFLKTTHDALDQSARHTSGETAVVPARQTISPTKNDVARKTFALQHVEFRGSFYILAADGRKLIGNNAALVPIDNGARLVTGPGSHARLTLPDGSVFTLGENTEIQIDEFVYDPNAKIRNQVLSMVALVVSGTFRLVTGVVQHGGKCEIKVPHGSVGIRGTDVETNVRQNDSGYIKLFSGKLEITEKNTGRVFPVNEGEIVTFSADGVFSHPSAFNGASP